MPHRDAHDIVWYDYADLPTYVLGAPVNYRLQPGVIKQVREASRLVGVPLDKFVEDALRVALAHLGYEPPPALDR